MSTTKVIYFVRHGEAEGNVTKRFQSMETPLTEIGHQQAKIVAKRCKTLDAELLISSSMLRAKQTAEHIQKEVQLPFEESDDFIEIKQATSMQGKSRVDEEGQEYILKNRKCYISNTERYEDAENYADVQARITKGLAYLASRPEEKIILTCHGALLKTIFIHVLFGGEATAELDNTLKKTLEYSRNTAINVIKYQDDQWMVDMYNDHAHFGEYTDDSQHAAKS